jgi:uncharacterized DUF497 family protein
MEFEWDKNKAVANISKHEVSTEPEIFWYKRSPRFILEEY